jgi:hypothetical protein
MRLAIVLTVTVLAGACASTEPPLTTVGLRDVDQAKMDAVEEAAARNGVRVFWINPPLRPEPAKR